MIDQADSIRFEAGDLALNFLNTLGIRRGRPVDVMASSIQLQQWLGAAGLGWPPACGLATSLPAAREALHEARVLREEIGHAVQAVIAGDPVPVTSSYAINRVLASSRISLRLEPGEDGLRIDERETGSGVLTALAPIALAAAELLADANPSRIRQCGSAGCMQWFLDTSKNGRRRWCSMARCGNREKANKHYAKTAQRGVSATTPVLGDFVQEATGDLSEDVRRLHLWKVPDTRQDDEF